MLDRLIDILIDIPRKVLKWLDKVAGKDSEEE
jgi:hypothetical protein